MKIVYLKPSEIALLLPLPKLSPDDNLCVSIENNGLLQPLVINGNRLCDGHRRIAALLSLGNSDLIPCVETQGECGLIYAQLNANREFSVAEVAALLSQVNFKPSHEIYDLLGVSESPQMNLALRFIAEKVLPNEELSGYSLPLNVWRELGHLGDDMPRFAIALLKLTGSFGEKRNIASLLRQAARKGALPDELHGNSTVAILSNLQRAAQPRRTSTIDKFDKALKNAELPPAVQIKIDPTFSQPGIMVSMSLKRNQLDRIDALKKSLSSIFNSVEEL